MDTVLVFSARYVYLAEVAAVIIYFFMQSRDRKKAMAIVSAIAFPLTYILAKIASFLYFDPRPFVVDGGTPLIAHVADNGFPSDHMLFASALASLLFIYNKKLGAAAFVIAFIVGAARVYAGIHHWTDIVGSAGIAVMTLWLVQKYIAARAEKAVDGFF